MTTIVKVSTSHAPAKVTLLNNGSPTETEVPANTEQEFTVTDMQDVFVKEE